jgi:hypothetical protein
MSSIFNVPPELVDLVGKKLIVLLAFLAAVGALSMAIVQVFKDLGPVRQWFNRGFLWNWFLEQLFTGRALRRRRIFGWKRAKAVPPLDAQVEQALHEAVFLAAGGHELALLDLGVEQLCGQLTSASQVALEYPRRYQNFFRVLTAGAEPEDVEVVFNGNPLSLDFASGVAGRPLSEADLASAKQRYLEARARIGQFVQRSIDALHIRLGARWKWWMQLASFAVSAAVTYAALVLNRASAAIGFIDAVQIVGASFVAGFLAPVARDIVAAVQSRK